MQIGLFTADNIILQTLLFFMTYSVVYSIVVAVYEDIIIRENNVSVGLVVIFFSSVGESIFNLILTFMSLPMFIRWWTHTEDGKEDFKRGSVGTIVLIFAIAVISGVFFGINYLLVDAGAGHYCKVWTI